ncbi:alpha/beta fold hydrolase, partial [Actinomadura roseirufa]|uniref:alpha/beta fold hydrolase n=1 Tax=Actinomadura roseirufa TaxID=2094049 RepID=UPI001F5FB995
LLAALGERRAAVAGIDAGAPPAFLLAMRRPDLVRRLVLMESSLGGAPRAEGGPGGGPPWWFGFHAVPGLAETVLAGHEAEYVDWFLGTGTRGRLTVPTLAIGAEPVGALLEHQLRPIADDLAGHLIEDCGHIVPLDRPHALLSLLRPFLRSGPQA